MEGVSRRRRYTLAAIAALVAVFVAVYPYLDLMGHCDDGGCPEVAQVSVSSSPDLPVSGVLSPVISVVCVAAIAAGLIAPFSERRPHEILISPEPPPPRL